MAKFYYVRNRDRERTTLYLEYVNRRTRYSETPTMFTSAKMAFEFNEEHRLELNMAGKISIEMEIKEVDL